MDTHPKLDHLDPNKAVVIPIAESDDSSNCYDCDDGNCDDGCDNVTCDSCDSGGCDEFD